MANFALFAIALVIILIGKPFTRQYARQSLPPGVGFAGLPPGHAAGRVGVGCGVRRHDGFTLPCHRQSARVLEGQEPGGWSPASAVDRDCASGLVKQLIFSVIVELTF